jgi:hypothetical protein
LSQDEGYTANLYEYLVTTFPNSNLKQDKRSWLKFDKTETLLYVNGSKKHDADTGWYDLDESIYNTLMSADNAYQAIILGDPKTTFVLSKNIIKDIFSVQSKLQRQNKSNRWMFSVSENNSRYFLVFGGNANYDITEYLNKWDVIPELSNPSDGGVGFTKLQRFVLDEMQMRANYQPIMIKTLLESGGRASRDEIAARIRELNSDNLEQDFRNIPALQPHT